jgi:tRNA(Ile)-lysidine synthase
MLCVTRDEVESYLSSLHQSWREDESNLDRRLVRNRIRHQLLPLLEREYNANVRQVLSDSAEIARGEEEYWQAVVEREVHARTLGGNDLSEVGLLDSTSLPVHPVQQRFSLTNLTALPLALQRRVLRRFAENRGLALDFEHVEKLLRCAHGDVARTDLPGGWTALRRGDCLELSTSASGPTFAGYKYHLPVPGEVYIAELGLTLRAVTVREEFAKESNESDNFLSPDLVGPALVVRNWQPGDRFWPVHTGSEEKLKRLFAEQHIPAEQRASWPVVLSGEQLVWVRGFPVARAFAWAGPGDAIRIETFQSA